ncbi:carboxypeptidase-like regulatory domain-containing protein [Hymenobacter jeollabukensis]|uniref:Carboxypeptidase-like regulatory domain-containing protein n=1 Tax=Hymenobacter jeollabukensis TaxID=2025313 RepID=A0A5R8WTX0_9BACT|nr:carboxypeptidase-like regulatory domain-containing protein [Hymenobacter jeollabukensis]TLM95209.1 carboxypeptidase-like regulatory domain-containing protein [Hymenobacter jeollabukensis]
MRFSDDSAGFSRTYALTHILLGLGATLLTAAGRPNPAPPLPIQPAPAQSASKTSSPDTTAYRLRGQLLDAYTQEPLPAAALWLKHLALGTQSDEQGYFAFELTADQLAESPTDTLQVKATAFRLRAVPVLFLQQSADSLLRVVVQRDSVVTQPRPLPGLPRREVRRLGKATSRPVPQRASTQ